MQKHQPKPSPASALADQIKAFIDCIKGLVTTGFLVAVLFFVYINWDDLKGLVHNLKSVKFAGAEAEFGDRTYADYEKSVLPGADERGTLTVEEHNSIIARAIWLLPVLRQSNLLWVDPYPEYSNRERQLLQDMRINVRLLRDINDALDDLKNPQYKFDLVVSTLTFVANLPPPPPPPEGRERLKGPLTACPVHWFEVPENWERNEKKRLGKDSLSEQEMDALLKLWNEKTNEGMHSGFLLAEHMQSDLLPDKRPAIIFYTNFGQPAATPCSPTITSNAFVLYDSILNQLERKRWSIMEGFKPPWAPNPPESTPISTASPSQN
jgi:hypothetical protein